MPATLFAVEEVDGAGEPPARPAGPAFWVRRVVLLKERTPAGEVIRDIPLRRGLNVIRVIDRPPGYRGTIGHSVGKTLLARFIRYCLGERYYAAEEVAEQVTDLFPSGYVVAEVVVGTAGWVVARPFAVGGEAKSLAWRSDDWKDAVDPVIDAEPFDTFTAALSDAAIGRWPKLRLPGARRHAAWLDLLGWLSRDQDCHFTHFNDWRSKDSHSGTKQHHRDDASLIAAWGLGLIDAREAEERAAHLDLLSDREEQEQVLKSATALLAASRAVQNTRFPDLNQEPDDTLFTRSASAQAQEKVQQLRDLLDELELAKSLTEAKQKVAALHDKHTDQTRVLGELKGRLQAKEGQLQTELSSKYGLECYCPSKPGKCPANQGGRVGATAAESAAVAGRLEGEVDSLRAERDAAQQAVDATAAELKAMEASYGAAEKKHRSDLRKLGEDIGRWEAHGEELKSYRDAVLRGEKADRKVKNLSAEIDKSERRLRERREASAGPVGRLSSLYRRVVSQLLGQDTPAELQFDGKGVHPKPTTTLRANGLGMATLATVIGFDLMALQASVDGLAPLPGFLLHDSPKASDLESVLYERVYEPLLAMDSASPWPAFQYLITTTTPPPAPAGEQPYVRLVLDARTPEGRLLKVEF